MQDNSNEVTGDSQEVDLESNYQEVEQLQELENENESQEVED